MNNVPVAKVPPQRPIPPVAKLAPAPAPTPEAAIAPEVPAAPIPPVVSIPPIPPVPASEPASTVPRADIPVFHAPAPVPPPAVAATPERFVLQFSTGESVTVTGTGIIGRNPSKEPGEFVDHLVTVVDYDKSVSKSHLDFGQDEGRFWVSDRYSANGTTVREPDREPRRCAPGVRVHVARGSRVDMGEQFFIVS